MSTLYTSRQLAEVVRPLDRPQQFLASVFFPTVRLFDTTRIDFHVLNVAQEQRDKVVVGTNASGQVREFQLRLSVQFGLTTPAGKELLPSDRLALQRDFSYNESYALAKETEEALLYRDMQTDIVQQILRRLATVRLNP